MPIRVAVIGTGRRGQQLAHHLIGRADVEVVAVCDANSAAAEGGARAASRTAATRRAQPRVYTRYEMLLAQEQLDAVVLATSPAHRGLPAVAAAERGLHLFLEPPVAAALPDAVQIARAADRAGVVAAVGYQWRYLPGVARAKEVLGGLGGRSALVRLRWCEGPPPEGLRDKRRPGRLLLEQSAHLLDLSRWLLGEVTHVHAAGSEVAGNDSLDGTPGCAYAATLRFHAGAVGTLTAVVVDPTSAAGAGSEAGAGTWALETVAPDVQLRLQPSGLEVQRRGQVQEVAASWADCDTAALDAFVDAVRIGRSEELRSPLRDAVRTLAVSLACLEAARTGQVVRVAQFYRTAARPGRTATPLWERLAALVRVAF